MKKHIIKIVSVILAITMAFTMFATTAFAKQSVWQRIGTGALAGVISTVLGGVNSIFPEGDNFIDKADFTQDGFYSGTGEFQKAPAENAKWKLGYANASLVPDDWQEHKYFIGGYIMIENFFTNKVEGVIDDMKVRTIAIEDSTGRGISIFATIDCIGITNNDIKEIRSALEKKAAGKYDFAAINVSSTHAHSCIDTEGLWTDLFKKVIINSFRSLLGLGKLKQGTDEKYMDFLYDTVSDAMLSACDTMTEGTMTYARKDIGADYFNNKNRKSASSLMTDMSRLVFTPDDASIRPTMILNIAAHPDVAGLPTKENSGREVCGEYVYYLGETLDKAGFNCMFINGAIAGIYMSRGASNDSQDLEKRYMQSERYGIEIGKMALAMTMTKEEIMKDKLLYDEEVIAKETANAEKNGGKYTLWCENWEPVEETEVAPYFNIVLKQVFVPVTNPFIAVAGKLNLANYTVLRGEKGYEICTEIGYVEFGDSLKAVMMPGEICQDVVYGGTSLTKDDSYSGKAFAYPCITELFGNDDLICFGLTNDAVGYVVPDNDYAMSIAFDHYHELISLGKYAASTMMDGFESIVNFVK